MLNSQEITLSIIVGLWTLICVIAGALIVLGILKVMSKMKRD